MSFIEQTEVILDMVLQMFELDEVFSEGTGTTSSKTCLEDALGCVFVKNGGEKVLEKVIEIAENFGDYVYDYDDAKKCEDHEVDTMARCKKVVQACELLITIIN